MRGGRVGEVSRGGRLGEPLASAEMVVEEVELRVSDFLGSNGHQL